MSSADVFGWIASVCMIMGYLPQAIHTIRTRETDAIAMPTFVMMGLGALFFIIQGIIIDNWPLAVTNTITLACSVTIFSIKIYNDTRRPRR